MLKFVKKYYMIDCVKSLLQIKGFRTQEWLFEYMLS